MDFVSDWLLFLPYSFDDVPVPLPPDAPVVEVATTPLLAGLYVLDRSRFAGSTVLVTRSLPSRVYVVCAASATAFDWSDRGSATCVDVSEAYENRVTAVPADPAVAFRCSTFVTRSDESYVNAVHTTGGSCDRREVTVRVAEGVFAPVASVYVVMSPAALFAHETERELEPLVCENVWVLLA